MKTTEIIINESSKDKKKHAKKKVYTVSLTHKHGNLNECFAIMRKNIFFAGTRRFIPNTLLSFISIKTSKTFWNYSKHLHRSLPS